jgi:2-hydroxy-6-oxonona-2,4-dienedioate hydrolase
MMKTQRIAGGIACRVEGSGPPLALFHGGAGSWTHWIRNIPALAERFTVYAFDLPGGGDSDDVPADIAPENYVDLVCAGVDEIAAGGRIFLAGFSFGAVNAAMVTARMPGTIAKLALLAPGGLGRVNNAGAALRKMPPATASEDEKKAVVRHNLRLMMLAHDASIDDATIAIQRENIARTRYDSRRFTGSTLTKEYLWRVHTRTLAIFGALDNLSYPSVYARITPLRCTKPDVEIELIPAKGHWIQYEAADQVNRLLIDWFSNE